MQEILLEQFCQRQIRIHRLAKTQHLFGRYYGRYQVNNPYI